MSAQTTEPSPLALIRKSHLIRELGVSVWTLDRWVRTGQFPKPIYPTDASPAFWRRRDIEAWLEKRRVKRRKIRPPSGNLVQDHDEECQCRVCTSQD